ncbi:hypothetical protein [Streptomyces sp. MP131-18]|uniref:hypothetical protein n=1 Tax=Streptomyces sp. MP131-18 TaxID=1857892 RepID=UPI00097C871B|nr:hypothetical protein [Streptomyces sp. MP131-18]ONK12726.1 hypothetical protein STBA_34780 [Streptomyces sp. MP131-18]
MRAGADLRVLRAAVFAAACATLAAAGHVWATGPVPPPAALAAGWAAAFALALPLAGRERRSVPAIAATLAAAQLALHALYCLGRHAPAAGGAEHGGGAGDAMALAARLLCNDHALALTEERAARIVDEAGLAPHPGAAPGAADAAAGLGEAFASLASAPMLLGHLLAALAAAWLLRRGEAALWRLIRLSARVSRPFLRLVRVLLRALHAPRPCPPAPCPPRHRHHRLPAPRGTVIAAAVTRRGPPHPAAHHLALAA